MVSLPLPWFLLSIDFDRYVGTCLGTEGTADTTFRFFHVNNVVPALVIVGGVGEHILGTEADTQPATLAALLIDYYCSFWHVCALSENTYIVCRCSTVPPSKEATPSWMIRCLWHSIGVLCGAIGDFSDLPAAPSLS